MRENARLWHAFLGELFIRQKAEYCHVRCLSSSASVLVVGNGWRNCQHFPVRGNMDKFANWLRIYFFCNLDEQDLVRDGRTRVKLDGKSMLLRAIALPEQSWIIYPNGVGTMPSRHCINIRTQELSSCVDLSSLTDPVDIMVSGKTLELLKWMRPILPHLERESLTLLSWTRNHRLPVAKWGMHLSDKQAEDWVAYRLRRWYDIFIDFRPENNA